MALVAKMIAQSVIASGGGRWVACAETDEGAAAVADTPAVHSTYGVPPWLNTTGFVRYEHVAQNAEQIKLTAVSAQGEDDPNREWAMASPSGTLEMYIQNPAAFGYVKAGEELRVTIERIRRPRPSNLVVSGGLVITSSNTNTVEP